MRAGLINRAAHLRDEPGILDSLLASGAARMVIVDGGRARVADGSLVLDTASDVPGAHWALLGESVDGVPLLLAARARSDESVDAAPAEMWLTLRETGGMLTAEHTELFIEALALSDWLVNAAHCPRCGAAARLQQAGWSRRCDACEREVFPRTDPAVIVAVESVDGERLLLGANAQWRGEMYSCFAGFTEAGESLEMTVHRELFEESGVHITALTYVSSQAWPYPRSLMLGFRATAEVERNARPDGEEIVDVRWFTRAEIGAALAGEADFRLPGPASIARALIVGWFEERS